MVKKLESYELDLNINKTTIDKKLDKYLEINHEINKIFHEYDLNLSEAQLILESLLHGVLKMQMDGYMDIKEIE